MQNTISVISLTNIRQNALNIRAKLGGGKFYAVVKADAYGHGAERVALSIEDIVDGFCVAVTEEGIALRAAGISKPVLVFTPPLDGYDVARAEFYDLLLTVNCAETAKSIHGLPCHIKVNTGMNRYGCSVDELSDVLNYLDGRQIKGVYSHLYAPHCDSAVAEQLELFNRAERLVKSVSPEACAHIAASGGILRGGEALKDGARCGILLYGYAPHGFKADVLPALKVYARRVQTTAFVGGGLGYGFADKKYKMVGAYRAGYADGFLRGVPLGKGNLCMDAFVGDADADMLCVMDDADAYAERAGTISYEVLTSVTRRSQRVYI